MYSFKDDYSEWGHPHIMQALIDNNNDQQPWYGNDIYSLQAKELIKEHIQQPDAHIHFVSWWTQANLIVIAATLRPHESVICAATGHINIHEAGAIEAIGHKINEIKSDNGKITPDQIQQIIDNHQEAPHMVKPKMVYISQTTEVGTIYSYEELQQLSTYCKNQWLLLFLDGARLWSALAASDDSLTMQHIAQYTDIFYIGWTKNGTLFGEAIVITNQQLQTDFDYHIKQRWWLLAKWRAIGVQFRELFTNNLYITLATHANKMASKLTQWIQKKWYSFLTDSVTNQLFPVFDNKLIESISKQYWFYTRQKINKTETAIRLVTSRATNEQKVDEFLTLIPPQN